MDRCRRWVSTAVGSEISLPRMVLTHFDAVEESKSWLFASPIWGRGTGAAAEDRSDPDYGYTPPSSPWELAFGAGFILVCFSFWGTRIQILKLWTLDLCRIPGDMRVTLTSKRERSGSDEHFEMR